MRPEARCFKLLSFLIAAISFVLFAEAQSNVITAPTPGERLTLGQPYTIRWNNEYLAEIGTGSTVTLILGKPSADSNDLQTVTTVGESINNSGLFRWNVPLNIAPGVYQLKIWNDDAPNNLNGVSQRFSLTSPDGASSDVVGTTSSTPSSQSTASDTPQSNAGNAGSSSIEQPTQAPTANPSSTSEGQTDSQSQTTSSRGSETDSGSQTTSGSQSRPTTLSSRTTGSPNSQTTQDGSTTTSSSPSGSPPSTSNGPPVGAIVGGVIGGLALIAICVLLGLWIIVRERRKKAVLMGGKDVPQLPPAPPDPNNQSIWGGGAVQSVNPRQDTSNIYPGRDTLTEGIAGN
ncbi:hypothetical protein ABW20_dc0104866 [Dactylellina cionopaga]|nr:hypothetical protein ABW20_dc0104866 [Dactylellina cionopaga]